MNMMTGEAKQLLDDFDRAVLVLGAIQQGHARSLQHNHLTDIQQWSDERSQAMAKLQQALSGVWSCDVLRSDVRLGQSLQRRIGEIVDREKILAAEVKSCQRQLQDEMGKIRKGKKAMGGYGASMGARSTGLCFKNSL